MTKQARIMEARYGVPYNWLHEPYSSRWAHKEGLCRIVLGFLGTAKDILDYGCGDGWYAARFTAIGSVTGIDISERAIGFAKLIVPEGKFLVDRSISILLPDRSYDIVVCLQVLEHLPEADVAAALLEFRRVLKPGGRLIVSVPSIHRPFSKAHLRHYTPETFKSTLTAVGEVEEMVGHESSSRFALWSRKLLDNRLWLARAAARVFYERMYFKFWNLVPAEKGNNLIAVVSFRPLNDV